MATISIKVTRDSVCAGDDLDGLHLRQIDISEMTPVRFVIQRILESGYLPSISGGHAAWLIESGRPIGVVAQQWTQGRFFVDGDAPISQFLRSESKIHFRYEVQKDPEEVFKEYKRAGERENS